MKTDTVFKRAFNDAIDLVSRLPPDAPLPPENALSLQLGVSRTTARKVIGALKAQGLVNGTGRYRSISRPGDTIKRYPISETVPMAAQVEEQFMEWMLRDNARPGTAINELELARKFGVATTGIREFLNRFQRFGLMRSGPMQGGSSRASPPASRWNCSRSGRCSNSGPRAPSLRCRIRRRTGRFSRLCAASILRCSTKLIRNSTTFPISTAASTG